MKKFSALISSFLGLVVLLTGQAPASERFELAWDTAPVPVPNADETAVLFRA